MTTLVRGGLLAALTLLACGCASEETSAARGETRAAFDLKGWRLIGCCCGAPCPCRVNKKPQHRHGCDHTDAVHIDRGYAGDVDLSGMTWVIVGRGFGEDTKENWVYVYVADTATEAQFKALGEMLNADVASWGGKAAHLAGRFVGMRKVPITSNVGVDGTSCTVTIPGILELQTKAIVNPGRTEPVRSTGIMDAWGDSFTHMEPVKHTLTDRETGYSWNLAGRQANFAEFHMTPEKKTAGGGWGCWTANAAYGDNGPYEEQLEDGHK